MALLGVWCSATVLAAPLLRQNRSLCRTVMTTDESLPDCHRYIDMWAIPSIHPSNVELLQKLKTADSGHFNTHMDVVGTLSEMDEDTNKWEKTHIIGLRSDIWNTSKSEMRERLEILKKKRRTKLKKSIKSSGRLSVKQTERLESQLEDDKIMTTDPGDIENRRVVLKLFKTTGTRVRWCGTIEEVTATEVTNSMGSKRSLVTLVVMLPRMEFVTYIQQNHRTFRIPSVFTFGFFDNDQMWNLTLKRKWFSFGADYDIAVNGKPIGEIDGKLIGFGSNSYLDIENHPLAKSTQFVDLMTLFTASIGYHKKMRRSIKRRVAASNRGDSHCHLICSDELRLRHNGRAAA